MPVSDRPREKAERLGFGALSDAELLAIFIRTGVPGRNALQVASDLLRDCGGFTELARRTPAEIRRKSKGIGPAKSLEMAAAFEIGKRLARGDGVAPLLDTPARVFEVFGPEMVSLRQESLRVLLLDAKLRLVRAEEIARGSVNECLAHPREIFRHAVVHSAYAVVVLHNHPSGDPSPSAADHRVTKNLLEAARLLQINLLDHIILGSPDGGRTPYFSFREAGLV
ncbi:MAG: RadC family protein [Terrimicrobiaceae bacterium]|jgi:DNA repair protein RadC